MRRRKFVALTVTGSSLGIAGCGGDETSGDDGSGNGDDGTDDSGNGTENGQSDPDGAANDNDEEENGDDESLEPEPDIGIVDTSLSTTEAVLGDEVTVTVDLENVGGAEGDHAVVVYIGEETVHEETVTVGPDETESVTADWNASGEGTVDVLVNDEGIGTVTVEPVPEGEVRSIRDVKSLYETGTRTFSGSGYVTTDEFELDPGYAAFIAEHVGEGNFGVSVREENGTIAFVPAVADDTYDGAAGIPVDGGTYFLDVTADGDWSIEVVQPRTPAEDVRAPPVEASGHGDDVVGPVRVEGRTTITADHDGENNFVVELADELATSAFDIELAFNESGSFDGETSVEMDASAWINVVADGDWSLSIE